MLSNSTSTTRSKRKLIPRQKTRVVINGSTFDFVGSGGSDLSFAVFQEVLEGWNQVVFSDLRSDGFLELDKAGSRGMSVGLNCNYL